MTTGALEYAAYHCCPCGRGLARERASGPNASWSCAAVLEQPRLAESEHKTRIPAPLVPPETLTVTTREPRKIS
jgi:hypothetical protein